jgi:uncharacterized protein (TIGR03663 family)
VVAKSDTLPPKTALSTPIFSVLAINWEIAFYLGLFILAVLTRFYDLGARVMSHDESLHTVYSWNLYVGKGYSHDPLMHGPFLFHINALLYFLFGDNDFTARISTALFGVALVILPYWFRPWLGRLGALAASLMILISPGLLYYSRYIRHDTFITVWTTLMFLSFFQYMRYRRSVWIYIGAAAIALMLCTKEVAYIHGFIGVTFVVFALLWENISRSNRQIVTFAMLGVAFLLVVGSAYFILNSPLPPVATAGETPAEPSFLAQHYNVLVMLLVMVMGFVMIQLGVDRENRPVTQAVESLTERLPTLGKALLLAAIIFVLLYTTFFSNIYGLVSGTYGAISYWLSQQEVQRGGQPWYYYLFLVPLYEFLPVVIGLIGSLFYLFGEQVRRLLLTVGSVIIPSLRQRRQQLASSPNQVHLPDHTNHFSEDVELSSSGETVSIWPSDGGLFAMLTIYWTLLAVVIYSWAGEKMPWLTVHMTLPFIFLTAHVIQTVLGKFRWVEVKQQGGLILGVSVLLLIPALVALLSASPFQSQSLQSINETIQFIVALLVLSALGFAIWYYVRQIGWDQAKRAIFVTLLIPLLLLTIRFTWLFSYVNYDYVNEMLVYAHASPDVKLALAQIDDISRRTVGDKMIKVAYDNDSTWPLEWYLREYPNRTYYGENPTREALDAPIVIVGSANETKVKPFLGDKYVSFRYRLVWWPVEDYKNQTLAKLWENYVVGPPAGEGAVDTAQAQATRREVVPAR